MRIWRSLFKCNYLKNENLFLSFFVPFMEHTLNFKHLQKKKIVLANVFPKLQNVKDLVRPLSKKRSFRTFFDSQHVKRSPTFVKSGSEHFDQIFQSLWEEMIWKYLSYSNFKSEGWLLTHWQPITSILFRIVRICRSLFTCNYLKNEKLFLSFFVPFMESTLNFKHLHKKKDRPSQCISEITACQGLG